MAYFLKKQKQRNKTYLAIYDSFYNHDKKGAAHKCIKSLGSLESHIANGMKDPIAHFQKEVDALNRERKELGVRKVSDKPLLKNLGYFPLKSILGKLQVKPFIDLFSELHGGRYSLFELLSSLIFARAIHPCSKRKTFHEVIPQLYGEYNFSYSQLLDGLAFLGANYEKFIQFFTKQTSAVFGINTEKTYFDCTNFYFEIDREDDFRRKGPSKEQRKDPLVGLGLLLDNNQIPIGMKMYPGNESEKPVLREVIDQLKKQNHVVGRTIHVADKGLNCAQNIAFSRKQGDGYLFSKSVKGLSEKEKVWVFLDQGWKEVRDKQGKVLYSYKSCVDNFPYTVQRDGKRITAELREKRVLTYNPTLAAKKRHEILRMVEKARSLTHSQTKRSEYGESGKYVTFTDKRGEKAAVSINQKAIDKDLAFAGYNLLVTSETNMTSKDMYNTYHNLWRIEESFKIMKSDLDARPVFLHKQATIQGHFFICYLTVLLERLFQFKILNNKYSASAIFDFIRKFQVMKHQGTYVNALTASGIVEDFPKRFSLPIDHVDLSETQIKSILNYKM